MLEELKFDLSGRTTSNEDIVQLVPDQVMEQVSLTSVFFIIQYGDKGWP